MQDHHSAVAIIPARGGSKGVPRKNLRTVGGISLVGRSIIAAKSAATINAVYVSTDDSNIKEEALRYGAEVIERPKHLADDHISTDDVIEHAALHILKQSTYNPEVLVLIQATYAHINSPHIDFVVDQLRPPHDATFGAVECHSFIWSASKGRDDNDFYTLSNRPYHFSHRPRRQDDDLQYLELGSVYAMRTESFMESKSRFCFLPKPVLVKNAIVGEIDNYLDLQSSRLLDPLSKHCQSKPINASNLKILLIDFDGVLTNNKLMTDTLGNEIIETNKYDSLAISSLQNQRGIPVHIITTELSATHVKRAEKMKTSISASTDGKGARIQTLLEELGIKPSGNESMPSIIYVGNDLNDLPVMPFVDLFASPIDGHPAVLANSNIIIGRCGGEGVISELYAQFHFDSK